MLPKFSCSIARDVKTGFDYFDGLFLLDAYGGVYSTGFFGLGEENSELSAYYPCITWDGRTDAYRPGQDHAREIEVVAYRKNFPQGYYLLSKDATIYACGGVPVEYTKLNQKFNVGKGNEAVAMALDINEGIVVLDSHGHVYTSGSEKYLGQEDFTENIARDIQLLPENKGYGILSADGTVNEFKNN